MSSGKSHCRLHALFAGRVQGVGFRFTVCDLARTRQITGVVKNMPDGTVELKAEGSRQELTGFLHAIRASRLGRYIAYEDIQWQAADGTYKGFGIEF